MSGTVPAQRKIPGFRWWVCLVWHRKVMWQVRGWWEAKRCGSVGLLCLRVCENRLPERRHEDKGKLQLRRRGGRRLASDARIMQTLHFKTSAEFRRWLAKNHGQSEGLWLRIFKKGAGKNSVTYAEALDQALCHGWIDGQKKSFDQSSWIQRFTPRRPKSGWSKLNTQHVERLTRAGAMTRAGLEAVAAAKADGRWEAAYASPRNAVPPEDFLRELAKDKRAKEFFKTLNKANVYAIVYRLQTSKKPETRVRRMKLILAMMRQGRAFHP